MNFIIKIFAALLAGKILKSLLTIIVCIIIIITFLAYTGRIDLGKLKKKIMKSDTFSSISTGGLKSVTNLVK